MVLIRQFILLLSNIFSTWVFNKIKNKKNMLTTEVVKVNQANR